MRFILFGLGPSLCLQLDRIVFILLLFVVLESLSKQSQIFMVAAIDTRLDRVVHTRLKTLDVRDNSQGLVDNDNYMLDCNNMLAIILFDGVEVVTQLHKNLSDLTRHLNHLFTHFLLCLTQ